MQLPHLFKKPAVSKPSFFFAIHLSDSVVQSALWKVDEGMIEVVSRSKQKTWQDDETCITAIDQSLQELSKEAETVKETLFALSPEWVTPEGILPNKKPLFQKITKELSLEAIGFVVTTEALLQHFTQTLSPQLSLFLIEVAASQLFITQVKQGTLLQTEKAGRSGDSVADLIEGFAHFKDKVFPSKFLLYSSVLSEKELEDIRQKLFGHDWPSEYPFLHPPVIDIFAPDHVLEIIIQTGGRAVAESKGLKLISLPDVKNAPDTDSLLVPNPAETELAAEAAAAVGGAGAVATIEEASDDFAAVALNTPLPSEENGTAVDLPEKDSVEDNLRQVANQEIEFGTVRKGAHAPAEDELEELQEKKTATPLKTKHLIPFLIGGVVIGLLLLFGIGTVAAAQLQKATVGLVLNTKPVSKDVTLTLDPTATASDPNQLLMKADMVTKDVQGTKTAQSTGSKIIGDKAKGAVTLYNRTSSPKTFTAGTVINGATQKYTLDTDTTIASASSGSDPTVINVGNSNATITAVAIGADSNISKNTDLTIDSFSKDSYLARTTSDISGGTSREILAVSADDQLKLKTSLLKDLTDQAAEEFKKDSSSGLYIVPTNQVKVLKSTYSADVGKEADNFSLSLQVEANGLSYQTSELKPLASQLLSTDLPANYTVKTDDIQVLSNPVLASTASAKVNLVTNISSVAVPNIDAAQLAQQIAGKSTTEAEHILKENPGVKSVTITKTPSILNIFSRGLPSQSDKIAITIK
ncbi:hypothetical protein BH10PAT2_BH10PAT2_0040 [soil metagenome]